jgi:tetratricopeptide (TPR) repeat protein
MLLQMGRVAWISLASIFLLRAGSLGIVSPQGAPQVQSLVRDGQRAIEAGNFARAVNDFEQAYQSAPDSLEVVRGLLLSCLQTGQLPRAIELGREAIDRWPKDAGLRHWLGLAYFKSQQIPLAKEELRRAMELDPQTQMSILIWRSYTFRRVNRGLRRMSLKKPPD